MKNAATFFSEDIETFIFRGLKLLHDGHEQQN